MASMLLKALSSMSISLMALPTPGQFLQVAHLLDLLDLVQEIVEVELVLLDFALQPLGFFFVILLLGALHQRYDVAHAQDAVRHA